MQKPFRIEQEMLSGSLKKAALAYAAAGWPVVLVHGIKDGRCTCGRRDCERVGKHPIREFFPHGYKSATTDLDAIRSMVRRWPDANIGIVRPDGVSMLDADTPEAMDEIRKLVRTDTLLVHTRRGAHFYFYGEITKDSELPKDVEVKSNRGFDIVPPSRALDGTEYEWGDGPREPIAWPLAPPSKSGVVRLDLQKKLSHITEGGRNSFLARHLGLWRYAGLSSDVMLALAHTLNETALHPPLDEREVERTVESINRYGSIYDEAFVTLADVKEEPLNWLYEPYILRGALNVLDGNPGLGKSFFCAGLAACVSAGLRTKFSRNVAHGDVVMLSAEDDPRRVLRKRVRLAGGDLSRVHAQDTPFTLDAQGLALLRAELERHHPLLVIIDPITAYFDASVDFYRANDMTQFLAAIELLAREFDCAIVIVRHLKKSQNDAAVFMGIGSVAISGRIRSGLLMGLHPEDPEIRAIAHMKSNYGRKGPTILFELKVIKDEDQPVIQWLDPTEDLDEDSIITQRQGARGRPSEARDHARAFLLEFLADGGKERAAVERAAETRSISLMTLRRASEELGVVKLRQGRVTIWTLPKADAAE
jgi:hypothetical protein